MRTVQVIVKPARCLVNRWIWCIERINPNGIKTIVQYYESHESAKQDAAELARLFGTQYKEVQA